MKVAKGFTLVELMVVVSIIGLLFAAAAPIVGDVTRNQLADRLYRELENDLRYARSYAVTQGTSVRFQPEKNWKNGWKLHSADSKGDFTDELRVTNVESEGNVSSTDFSNAAPLIFSGKGQANKSGNVTIEVSGCKGKRVRSLFINRIGQVILKEESACK